MKSISLLSIFSIAATLTYADDILFEDSKIVSDYMGDEAAESYYVFLSGQVNAMVKDSYEPIYLFDGKRIHFETTRKTIKPTGKVPCTVIPEVVISNQYAEIRGLEFSFVSRAARMREGQAITDMLYTQSAIQIGNEIEINDLREQQEQMMEAADTPEEVAAANEISNEIADIQLDEASMLDMIGDKIREESEGVDVSNLRDTLKGYCSIVPDDDIENAYCAITLSFKEDKAQLRLQGIRRSIVRVVPVGFIQAGIPNDLKFTCTFSEREIVDPKLEILLFSGEGIPIANNLSPSMKKLTEEQLEKYRELEGFTGAQVAQ